MIDVDKEPEDLELDKKAVLTWELVYAPWQVESKSIFTAETRCRMPSEPMHVEFVKGTVAEAIKAAQFLNLMQRLTPADTKRWVRGKVTIRQTLETVSATPVTQFIENWQDSDVFKIVTYKPTTLRPNSLQRRYGCLVCNKIHEDLGRAKRCCQTRLCECGEIIDNDFHTHCRACLWLNEMLKLSEKVLKKTIVPYSEYKGEMVYADWISHNEGFVEPSAVWDYLGDDLDEDETHGIYAEATFKQDIVTASLDDVISRCADQAWDDWDADSLSGCEELEAAMKKFNEANKDQQLFTADPSVLVKYDMTKPPVLGARQQIIHQTLAEGRVLTKDEIQTIIDYEQQ